MAVTPRRCIHWAGEALVCRGQLGGPPSCPPGSRIGMGQVCIYLTHQHLTWDHGGTPSTEAPAKVQWGEMNRGNSRPKFKAPWAYRWGILHGMSHLGLYLGGSLLRCQRGIEALIQYCFHMEFYLCSRNLTDTKKEKTKILTSGFSLKSAPTLA